MSKVWWGQFVLFYYSFWYLFGTLMLFILMPAWVIVVFLMLLASSAIMVSRADILRVKVGVRQRHEEGWVVSLSNLMKTSEYAQSFRLSAPTVEDL